MPTPNTDTTNMYRVNFGFTPQGSKKLRSGSLMIRAASAEAAKQIAEKDLQNESFDWYKINAIVKQ